MLRFSSSVRIGKHPATMEASRTIINSLVIGFSPHVRRQAPVKFMCELEVDGAAVVKGFLDLGQIERMNAELDSVFSTPVFNQSHRGFVWRNPTLKSISSLSCIRNFNLLELAIDVFHRTIPPGRQPRMILTNLEIFSEHNNRKPLYWHTDQRRGMIRAQIYLRGGGVRSGGFLYMRGTHKVDHTIEHKLTPHEIEQFKDTIMDCSGTPGDLVVFDSFGFHAKTVCIEERRTIMFEFQNVDSPYVKSSIELNNSQMSPKVIEQFSLFRQAEDPRTYGRHGLDDSHQNEYIPISMWIDVNRSFVLQWIRRIRRIV